MSEIDWPAGFDRTPAADRERNRSFEATIADTTSDLATELDRMTVDEWRASTASGGAYTKSNGLPKHNANPDDPGFALYWTKDGEQYAVACDDSPRLRDNMRYCYKWINETRMRSNRPVETGESEFATARLPSGNEDAVAADPPAHVVLGVDRDASPAEVEAAFRETARKVHPDAGGSDEAFKRAKRAKDELLPDENECVTDGGTTEYHCDEDDTLEILKRIPNNPDTMPFRHWVTGDLPTEHLDVDDCIEALLWSDHGVAIRAVDDAEPRTYWVNHHGDLQALADGLAVESPHQAVVWLDGELNTDTIDVVAVLAEDAPEPVRSIGKEIVTDGGTHSVELPNNEIAYIQCQKCGVVHPGHFGHQPTPPIPRQYCRVCNQDTPHQIVTIDEISYVVAATDGGRSLAELKRDGVVDGGRTECRLCGADGDCRPVPLTIRTGVPAVCNMCYRWIRDRGLIDKRREKELFYPSESADGIATDGGRPPLRRCSDCGLIHRPTEACRAGNGGGDR